jgi:hypothetical protein
MFVAVCVPGDRRLGLRGVRSERVSERGGCARGAPLGHGAGGATRARAHALVRGARGAQLRRTQSVYPYLGHSIKFYPHFISFS